MNIKSKIKAFHFNFISDNWILNALNVILYFAFLFFILSLFGAFIELFSRGCLWSWKGYTNFIHAGVEYFTIPLKILALIGVSQTLKYGFKKYEISNNQYELELRLNLYRQKNKLEELIIRAFTKQINVSKYKSNVPDTFYEETILILSKLKYKNFILFKELSETEKKEFEEPAYIFLERYKSKFAKNIALDGQKQRQEEIVKILKEITEDAFVKYYNHYDIIIKKNIKDSPLTSAIEQARNAIKGLNSPFGL